MTRRAKVELFDQIRREYEFGVGTIAGVARKLGIHRRTVRQAIACAIPPARKLPKRSRPKLDLLHPFIDQILEADRKAPRKQRHTAHRIYVRLCQEVPAAQVSERSVRQYVRDRKLELGLSARDVCVPQVYDWGVEAQVDWYEATAELDCEMQRVQIFALRSMASGAAFHRAYRRATQQAFLEAHQLAFHYFGGTFRRLRYDNLPSAVKKILRGHRREESERFLLFRSHWQFEASFCNPAQGHEKGGVEGEIGYFRRNHLVPVPRARHLEELNAQLLIACQQDLERRISGRQMNVGQALHVERDHLLPLQSEDFQLAEESFCRVDGKGCVQVRTNFYSTPLRPATRVRVRVLPALVEVFHEGGVVARHERCYKVRQQVLDLEHYLDVLLRKPGAFAGSQPLQQWREAGRWSAAHDQLWEALKRRYGSQAGTRLIIELLQLGRQLGYDRLMAACERACSLGLSDVAAVRHLLLAEDHDQPAPPPLELDAGSRREHYQRPLPEVSLYDDLLGSDRQTPRQNESILLEVAQ
jgi:transposase